MSPPAKKKAKPKGKKAPPKKPAGPKPSKTKKVVKLATPEEKPKKVAPKTKKVAEKKVAEKKEEPAKLPKAKPAELGPPPEAVIATRHIDSMEERAGRGFSFGELSTAGVPLNVAKREGLSVDVRRRSVVAGNVEALKGWLKSAGAALGKK
jgi:ribosomal protein L13E